MLDCSSGQAVVIANEFELQNADNNSLNAPGNLCSFVGLST